MENKYIGKFEIRVYEGPIPKPIPKGCMYLGVGEYDWPLCELPWESGETADIYREVIRSFLSEPIPEMDTNPALRTVNAQEAIERVLKDASVDDLIKLREAKLI